MHGHVDGTGMPSRSTDLSKPDLEGFRSTPEGVVFLSMRLAKQPNPSREIKEFFFPSFKEDKRLCPMFFSIPLCGKKGAN